MGNLDISISLGVSFFELEVRTVMPARMSAYRILVRAQMHHRDIMGQRFRAMFVVSPTSGN